MKVRINESPYPIVDLPREAAMALVSQGRAVVVSEEATLEAPEKR